MEPELAVLLLLENALEDRHDPRVGRAPAPQHRRGHPPHADALVPLDPLHEVRDDVDRVLPDLAPVTRERVHGPQAHLALRVAKQRDQRVERPVVRVAVHQHGAPPPDLPFAVLQAGLERRQGLRAELVQREIGREAQLRVGEVVDELLGGLSAGRLEHLLVLLGRRGRAGARDGGYERKPALAPSASSVGPAAYRRRRAPPDGHGAPGPPPSCMDPPGRTPRRRPSGCG